MVDFDGQVESDTMTSVKVKGAAVEGGAFTFDKVFPMNTRQQDVFEYGIKETVDGKRCRVVRGIKRAERLTFRRVSLQMS